MGTESAATAFRSVREILRRETVRELPDRQLLERFVVSGDEAAFAMLVRRHGPMVQGICRRTLTNVQDAEDAFQATFLVLVCKARAIGQPELLGNWLYGVATRVAAKARAVACRRGARETLLARVPDVQTRAGAPSLSELPVLDEEVRRLPAKYRIPFVLCYLDGLTNEEAARRLGCPKGTLQSRLSWARQRLRDRLLRRGVAPSPGLLAATFPFDQVRAAISPDLLEGTVHAARVFGGWAGSDGALPARAVLLARGVLHTMFHAKLKITAAILLAGLIPATGAGFWMRSAPASEPRAEQPPASPVPQTLVAKANTDEQPKTPPSTRHRNDGEHVTVRDVVKKSFQAGNAPHVVVDTFNGAIDIVTGSGKTVEVQVTKQAHAKTEEEAQAELKNVDVTMTKEGDAIHVTAKQREKHKNVGSGAAALLHVPPGAVLELHTNNGAASVTGGSGAIKLRTSNGAIRVKEHTGSLDVRTSNGAIDIRADKATVTAKTSNGSVTFAGTLADGDHSFTTSNGSISVSLPKRTSFHIDASTSLGRVDSEFPVKGEDRGKKRNHLRGQVGDHPAYTLKLHTSNGSIHVHGGESSAASR
jgi:RNA polymerase sigma-70 factor (ECF subfamily)